jgi:hypothetical protein
MILPFTDVERCTFPQAMNVHERAADLTATRSDQAAD